MQTAVPSRACLLLARMSPCSVPPGHSLPRRAAPALSRRASPGCSPGWQPSLSPGHSAELPSSPRASPRPGGLCMDVAPVVLSVTGLCRLSDPLLWMSFIQANIFSLTNHLVSAPGSEKDVRSKWQWLWSDPRHRSDALFIRVSSHKATHSPAPRPASPSPVQTPALAQAGSLGMLSSEVETAAGRLGGGQDPKAATLSALPCWEEARRGRV